MSNGLKLSILSPERRLLERAEVEEITLTSSEGQVQILSGHAPMIGTLQTGYFRYRSSNSPPVVGVISTGFFEVAYDEVHVMAETLELQGEIDIDRAKKAQQQAEETLRDAVLDEHQFKKYQLKLQRSIIRQQLIGRDSL